MEASTVLVASLGLLRSLSIILIGFLLLVPFVRLINSYLEKPIVAIGLDNSNSLQLEDTIVLNSLKGEIAKLGADLGDEYELDVFVFGDNVRQANWDLSDKRTNFSKWLKFLSNQYQHTNLAGVITVSDGVFNSGGNPTYAGYNLQAPIFNVALGDTISPTDARITYTNSNDIAYKDNHFPINVGVAAEKLKGEQLTLTLIKNGKEIASKPFVVTSDNQFQELSFLVDANDVGIQKYGISLTNIDSELSTANNYQSVFVEVIDADKNILVLYDAPHPDIAALRKSIERSRNYAVDLCWVNDPKKENLVTELEKYHLILFHNLPKSNAPIVKEALSSKASQMFVFDNTINFQLLNSWQDLFQVKLKSSEANSVSSSFNKLFVSYSLDKSEMESLGDYPPLRAAFADISFSNSSEAILRQKIGAVETNYPLLAISQSSLKKVGILPATGIWKWYLYEYAKDEENAGLDELFNQTIQFLSVKEDKRRLRLKTNKFLFNENEDVKLTAAFYDKNYQLATKAQVEATIKNADGKEFQFGFNLKSSAFEMNAGQLESGEYSHTIKATLGDEVFTLKGKFTVAEVNVEFMQPVANHNMLFQLADQNNGGLYYPDDMSKLITDIKNSELNKPIRHEKAEITELIHNKWLFFLLVMLMSTEWALRKFKGAS